MCTYCQAKIQNSKVSKMTKKKITTKKEREKAAGGKRVRIHLMHNEILQFYCARATITSPQFQRTTPKWQLDDDTRTHRHADDDMDERTLKNYINIYFNRVN